MARLHSSLIPLAQSLALSLALSACASLPSGDGASQAAGAEAPETSQTSDPTSPSTEVAKAPLAANADDHGPAAHKRAQAQYHVLAGEMAAGRNEPAIAAREFLRALSIVPDATLARRATELALSARDGALSAAAAKRWLQIAPGSVEPREVIARLALRTGELEVVHEQAKAIIDGHRQGPAEGFRHVALILSADRDAAEPVQSVLARLVDEHRQLAGAHYAMALAALRYDNLVQAEASARKALALEAESRDYQLLMVGVLVRKPALAEADQRMARLTQQQPEDARDLRMAYVKLLLEARQRAHARQTLHKALQQDGKHDDARYALGIMSINDGELERARQLLQSLADDPDRATEIQFQLGRVAEAQSRFADALAHYEDAQDGDRQVEAVLRRAVVLGQLQRLDEGRALLANWRHRAPALEQRFLLAEGELLVEVGQHAEAVSFYSLALDSDPANPDLLYGRSLAHEKNHDLARAEADLRSILADNPQDDRAMNALGYMLTVHTQRYAEAHKLISRALELSPEDPAIIDSMGWVEYKLGDTESAREYLEKAYAQVQDPEIAAHLGEVLWHLGERERAQQIWDRALGTEPDHEVLRETLQRLRP